MWPAWCVHIRRISLCRRKGDFSVAPSQYAPFLSAIISTDTIYFDNHLGNLVYIAALFLYICTH